MVQKSKHIVFRLDATPSIGTGHLMRCQVLASIFLDHNWSCEFVCSSETLETCAHLFDHRFTFSLEDKGIPQCALLVIDHYGLDWKYETTCRNKADKIFVIDDLANRQHNCDYLLDQTYGRLSRDYEELVPADCDIIVGPKFALLRKDFYETRPKAIERRAQKGGCIDRVLVSLGGTNLHGITERIINIFSEYQTKALHIDVVLGAGHISDDLLALVEAVRGNGFHKIALYPSVSNIEKLMFEADLAIGAGGTTSWERCCLGLPTLMFELADNQKLIAKKLHEQGAVLNLGWHSKIENKEITDAMDLLCKSPKLIEKMEKTAFSICSGKGALEVYSVIKKKLTYV